MVEAVGEGVDAASVAGRPRRVLASCPPCGQCGPCRAGRRTLCEPAGARSVAGMLLDGTSRLRAADGTVLQHGLIVACFAEYAVVPAGGAIPIPDDVPLWQAALLGCGVVTGFGAVTHAAGVRVGRARVRDRLRRRRPAGDRRRAARGGDRRSSPSTAARRSSSMRCAVGRRTRSTPASVDAGGRGPGARRRRRRLRVRGGRLAGDDPAWPGTRCDPAARPWSSGSRRRASRCRCRRSSSCPRRRSSAATTARGSPRDAARADRARPRGAAPARPTWSRT